LTNTLASQSPTSTTIRNDAPTVSLYTREAVDAATERVIALRPG
jgi:hypothetical protein